MTPSWPFLLAGAAAIPSARPRVRDLLENGSFTAFEGPRPAGWDVLAGRVRPADVAGEPAADLRPVDGEAVLAQRIGADAETPPLVPGVRHVLVVEATLREATGAGTPEARAEVAWRNPIGQTVETQAVPLTGVGTHREIQVPDGASQAEVRLRLSARGSRPTGSRLLVREVVFGPGSV